MISRIFFIGHLQVVKALITKCDAEPEDSPHLSIAIDKLGEDIDFMNPYSNGDRSGKDMFDQSHNPSHSTLYPDVLKINTIIVVKPRVK